MRYDERLACWPGVEQAMQREAATRANYDMGLFVCAVSLRTFIAATNMRAINRARKYMTLRIS